MKLKTVLIEGVSYAALDAGGMPIYVHDDGREVGFDAGAAQSRIAALNSESAGRRTEIAELTNKLKAFDGIEDADAARAALTTVANLDQGQLVTAGKVDEIKRGVEAAAEAKYAGQIKQLETRASEAEAAADTAKAALNTEMIGGNFARSQFVAEKLVLPPDIAETYFGRHFKIEDGQLVGYDAAGVQIFSRSGSGKPADFEEAIEVLVNAYPRKDDILKGKVGGGGGAQQPGPGGDATKNPWKRGSADYSLTEQDRIAAKDPALASRLKAEAGVA